MKVLNYFNFLWQDRFLVLPNAAKTPSNDAMAAQYVQFGENDLPDSPCHPDIQINCFYMLYFSEVTLSPILKPII